jgi:hypothetical protein
MQFSLRNRQDEINQLAATVPDWDPNWVGPLNPWLNRPPQQQKGFVVNVGITNSQEWSHHMAEYGVPRLMKLENRAGADQYGLTGFSRCYNMPGFSQDPIGYVYMDGVVQEASIAEDTYTGLKIAARVVAKYMKPHLKEIGVAFRRGAITGSHLFSKSSKLKSRLIKRLIRHFPEFIELVEKQDWRTIRIKFGASTLALLRRRHQSDKVTVEEDGSVTAKERRVADGKGGFIIANKELPEGYDSRMKANRERKVIAIDFILNMFEVMMSSLWRFVAAEFPHHWHVGSASIELRKYKDHYRARRPKAADVSNYDQHKPLRLLDYETDVFCDSMHMPDWYRIISKVTNAPPVLSPPTWMDGSDGPHMLGDPDHPMVGRELRAFGLPSGKGLTAAWHGKFANGVYCWIAWSKVFGFELSAANFESYLRHDPKWPVWAWNCGDDVCFWLTDAVSAAHEQAFIDAYHSLCSCWSISWDEKPSFLSAQIRFSAANDAWVAYKDAARGTSTIFDRESSLPGFLASGNLPPYEKRLQIYGLEGPADEEWLLGSNQFGCFGYEERDKLYQEDNPAWTFVQEAIEDVFESYRPGTMHKLHDQAQFERDALNRITTASENLADAEILVNPHYVYFRPEYDEYLADSKRSVLFVYFSAEEIKPITAAMAA